jgi:hypothetical protein
MLPGADFLLLLGDKLCIIGYSAVEKAVILRKGALLLNLCLTEGCGTCYSIFRILEVFAIAEATKTFDFVAFFS